MQHLLSKNTSIIYRLYFIRMLIFKHNLKQSIHQQGGKFMGFKKFCSMTLVAALLVSLLSFLGTDVEAKAASSGLWVLTDSKCVVRESTKDGGYTYNYSFNGISTSDGVSYVKFTKDGGWYGDYPASTYGTFESTCEVPPETIKPGDKVTLKISVEVISFEGGPMGIDEFCDVKFDLPGLDMGFATGGKKMFVDENNISGCRAHLSEKVYSDKRTVSQIIRDNPADGDKITIYFSCWAGMYTWEYTFKEGATVSTVKPSKATVKTLSVSGKTLTVKAKKITKNCSGYEFQISTDSKFKKSESKTSSKNKVSFKKLTSDTKYYIRVRAYYDDNGVKSYGKWSKIKSIVIS